MIESTLRKHNNIKQKIAKITKWNILYYLTLEYLNTFLDYIGKIDKQIMLLTEKYLN